MTAKKSRARACAWKYEEMDEAWEGGCGIYFSFNEAGPKENHFKWCPNCGKILKFKDRWKDGGK